MSTQTQTPPRTSVGSTTTTTYQLPPNVPWGKWVGTALAILTMFILTFTVVWSAATLTASKATKSEVSELDQRLNRLTLDVQQKLNTLSTDVAIIKTALVGKDKE